MNLVYGIFLYTVIAAGQAFPQIHDWDEDVCEIELYSTTVPRDAYLTEKLPQDTKTRIWSKVHSFWVTGNHCCWEVRRKRRLITKIHDNQDKWIHIRKPFVIRKCRP